MKWEKVELGDTATFINGFPFKPTDWSTSGKEIIRIQNLTKSNGLEANRYDGTIHERYLVKKGDLLISWSGTLGVYEWDGDEAWLNQHIFKVVFDKADVNKKYFKFLIQSKLHELEQQVHGATMKHITKGKFDALRVPLPPLHIQEQIADTLDKADALRRKDQELLQKYDQLAQAIFYDMFGDPVRNERGWVKGKLNEVCEEIIDCPHSTPVQSTEITEYPCIRTSELNEGFIKWSSMKYVDISEYNKRTVRLTPAAGDIVYGREGSFGEAIIIPNDTKICLGQRTMLFRPNEKTTSIFLWWQLRSDFVYNQALKKNCGATVGHVNVKDIKEFDIFIPPIGLQKVFEKKLENIIKTREVIGRNYAASTNLFNNYIHNNFSCPPTSSI